MLDTGHSSDGKRLIPDDVMMREPLDDWYLKFDRMLRILSGFSYIHSD
jgi:hypothetical protein